MVTARFQAKDEDGHLCKYVVDAIIDSGSPISLVRESILSKELLLPANEDVDQFCGINGSRLKITGVFYSELEIQSARMKIKFYAVPDSTMAFNLLLGRDFLSCPLLRVTLGSTVEIVGIDETNAIDEIMHIECDQNSSSICSELSINTAIGSQRVDEIREVYNSHYFENLKAEKSEPDFEMIIALKHDQAISSRPRRLSFADKESLRKVLDVLLEKKVIRPSESPYASPIVLEGNTFERTLSVCQDRDEEICKIRDELEKGEVKYYELRDGLVYRKDKNKKLLFYVPRVMETNIIRTCHDDLGHVGIDKVIDNITKVYCFPHIRVKVKEHIRNCLRCIEFSPPNSKQKRLISDRGKPNDLLRDLVDINTNNESERDFSRIRDKAQTCIEKSQRQNSMRYNLRRKAAHQYGVGDCVEIRNIETTPGIN